MEPTGGAGDGLRSVYRRLNFNSVAAGLFVALGVALLLLAPSQIEKPLLLMGQASTDLDPQLFPRLVAATLIVLGLWFLVESLTMDETNGLRALDARAYVNVAVSLGAFLAYALLMEPLGFVASSALLIMALSLFYGARDLRIILASAIGVPIVVYYTFTTGLKTFLPEAPW